jgi:hypothetical protein
VLSVGPYCILEVICGPLLTQRRLRKYFLYASADARSSGSASNFGSNFAHAASRLAGMYSVGQ